jgi:hypothetical protein
MFSPRTLFQLHTDFVLLEANAEQAGRALACSYSSSDEFEAATIQARRAAGVYGRPRRRRLLFVVTVLSAAVIVAFLFI